MGLIGLPEIILILVVAIFFSGLIKFRNWPDRWEKQQVNSRKPRWKQNERSERLTNRRMREIQRSTIWQLKWAWMHKTRPASSLLKKYARRSDQKKQKPHQILQDNYGIWSTGNSINSFGYYRIVWSKQDP